MSKNSISEEDKSLFIKEEFPGNKAQKLGASSLEELTTKDLTRKICRNTTHKYKFQIWRDQANSRKTATAHRMEAGSDFYKYAAHGAALIVTLKVKDLNSSYQGTTIRDAEEIFQFDVSSVWPGDERERKDILLVKGSAENLRVRGLSPAATKLHIQSLCQPRSFSCIPLINGTYLLAVLNGIRDCNFPPDHLNVAKHNSFPLVSSYCFLIINKQRKRSTCGGFRRGERGGNGQQ